MTGTDSTTRDTNEFVQVWQFVFKNFAQERLKSNFRSQLEEKTSRLSFLQEETIFPFIK